MFLSEHLKSAITIAQAISRVNRNPEFTPAHLLKGLLHKDIGLVVLLERLKKDVCYLQDWADTKIEACVKVYSLPAITGDKLITDIMYEANSIRQTLSKDTIDPIYALAALSTPGIGFTYDQMKTFPLRRDELIVPFTENGEMKVVVKIDSNPI